MWITRPKFGAYIYGPKKKRKEEGWKLFVSVWEPQSFDAKTMEFELKLVQYFKINK